MDAKRHNTSCSEDKISSDLRSSGSKEQSKKRNSRLGFNDSVHVH